MQTIFVFAGAGVASHDNMFNQTSTPWTSFLNLTLRPSDHVLDWPSMEIALPHGMP